MAEICLHCYISGRVQGVFYRRHTVQEASARGLKGWVKNTDDDRVELLVCGEKEKVDDLVEWLWDGPPAADVKNVEIKEVAHQNFNGFEQRN